MKKIVAGFLVVTLASCAAPQPDIDAILQTHLKPASDQLFDCGKAFYRRYASTKAAAATLRLAFDAYCAQQEAAVRLAGFEVERARGGHSVKNATYIGDTTVETVREKTVGDIVLRRL